MPISAFHPYLGADFFQAAGRLNDDKDKANNQKAGEKQFQEEKCPQNGRNLLFFFRCEMCTPIQKINQHRKGKKYGISNQKTHFRLHRSALPLASFGKVDMVYVPGQDGARDQDGRSQNQRSIAAHYCYRPDNFQDQQQKIITLAHNCAQIWEPIFQHQRFLVD